MQQQRDAAAMRDGQLDHLVEAYLKRRKLEHTLRVFQSEAPRAPQAPPPAAAAEAAATVPERLSRGLLTSFADNAPPEEHAAAFGALAAFVDGALDLYKPELARALYPVFVHTYLRLVARGAGPAAADFLRRHRARMGGGGARAAELGQLAGIALPQHVEAAPFARAARDPAAKPVVRMCAYAFELLAGFLHARKLWLPLAIMNEHLQFEVYDGPPVLPDAAAAAADADAGLLQGGAAESAAAINAAPVALGLLKEAYNVEDAYATAKLQVEEEAEQRAAAAAAAAAAASEGGAGAAAAAGAGAARAPAAAGGGADAAAGAGGAAAANGTAAADGGAGGAGGGEKLSRRARALRERAIAAAKVKLRDIEEARIDPLVPLPQLTDAFKKVAFADIEARAEVSPAAPPSCAFVTLTNARAGGACSVAFDGAARYTAAGMSDATVRLFDLAALGGARRQQAKAAQQRRAAEKRDGGGAGGAGGGAGAGAAAAADHLEGDDEDDEFEALDDAAERAAAQLHGHSAPVTGVDFAPDGALLLSASADGTAHAWSPELRRGLAAYRGHVLPVWCVAACAHGAYFATGGADRAARIWATDNNARPLRVLAGHQSDVDAVAWHPNSQLVATAGADRTVRLWDVRRGRPARVAGGVGGAGGVTALAFAPDGLHLAAGAEDGSIAVFDLRTARRVATLDGHEGPVWSLAYSRGAGALLASGGADRTVRLWSAPPATGYMVALVHEARAAVKAAEAEDALQQQQQQQYEEGQQLQQQQQQQQQQQAQTAAAAAAAVKPYTLLRTWRTRAAPVAAVAFTPRNLLLAGGAWALQPTTAAAAGARRL